MTAWRSGGNRVNRESRRKILFLLFLQLFDKKDSVLKREVQDSGMERERGDRMLLINKRRQRNGKDHFLMIVWWGWEWGYGVSKKVTFHTFWYGLEKSNSVSNRDPRVI